MPGEEPCMALTAMRPIRRPLQRDTVDAPTMRTHNVQLLIHGSTITVTLSIVYVGLNKRTSGYVVKNVGET